MRTSQLSIRVVEFWSPGMHRRGWSISSHFVHCFSVSIKLQRATEEVDWWLSSVYGPSQDLDKPDFLSKLHDLRSFHFGPWLLNDDFNLIYHAEDKNNDRLNWCLMGQFHRFLNEARLKEIHLNSRLFTWSNERRHPS
jgi:hypothetical protein